MSISQKYGRTLHYPFSPGSTSDDRVNTDYWLDITAIGTLMHTEKLDGENNCLSRHGVFARSHAAPTTSSWTRDLRERWSLMKNDLGNYEIFLENLYAIHSIAYSDIPSHYFVFAIREHDKWLSWQETELVASFFDLPLVPVINAAVYTASRATFEKEVQELAKQPGAYAPADPVSGHRCSMEGIVTRNIDEYSVSDFQHNVFKYVRAGHVQTDEHWTKNWKRAPFKNL